MLPFCGVYHEKCRGLRLNFHQDITGIVYFPQNKPRNEHTTNSQSQLRSPQNKMLRINKKLNDDESGQQPDTSVFYVSDRQYYERIRQKSRKK